MVNLLLLALLPTLISNLALVRAIKSIGFYADLCPRGYGASDSDRHGGALPRGASLLGDALGVVLILSAVTIIVLSSAG